MLKLEGEKPLQMTYIYTISYLILNREARTESVTFNYSEHILLKELNIRLKK